MSFLCARRASAASASTSGRGGGGVQTGAPSESGSFRNLSINNVRDGCQKERRQKPPQEAPISRDRKYRLTLDVVDVGNVRCQGCQDADGDGIGLEDPYLAIVASVAQLQNAHFEIRWKLIGSDTVVQSGLDRGHFLPPVLDHRKRFELRLRRRYEMAFRWVRDGEREGHVVSNLHFRNIGRG